MIHPLLKNKWYIAIFIVLCIIVGITQAALLNPIVDVPFYWLVLNGVIYSFILGAISIPLWIVIRYVDFSQGSTVQKWLNTIALCIITVGSWLGLGMLLVYLFFPINYFHALQPTVAVKIFGGIMLYTILVQRYMMLMIKEKAIEDEQEKDDIAEMISDKETVEIEEKKIEIIDRIAVKLGQKIHVISVPDIQYIQADGDYVMIHTTEGKFLKEQTMKYFEQHLPADKFVRVHRSCIVNVEIISRVELYEKQNYMLSLQNGQKIKASTNGYRLLKKTLSL